MYLALSFILKLTRDCMKIMGLFQYISCYYSWSLLCGTNRILPEPLLTIWTAIGNVNMPGHVDNVGNKATHFYNTCIKLRSTRGFFPSFLIFQTSMEKGFEYSNK